MFKQTVNFGLSPAAFLWSCPDAATKNSAYVALYYHAQQIKSLI